MKVRDLVSLLGLLDQEMIVCVVVEDLDEGSSGTYPISSLDASGVYMDPEGKPCVAIR
jgi:hypothetical protein